MVNLKQAPLVDWLNQYRSTLLTLAGIVLILLVLYELPGELGTKIRNPQQQMVTVVWKGSVYSLFALGYALVFSILGLLNLSHSAIFMWGTYCGLYAIKAFDVPLIGTEIDLPLWMALPAGMLAAGIISVIVDLVAFAPLRRRNAPRIAQLISSLGAAAVLISLAQLQFGSEPVRFPRPEMAELPYEVERAREIVWADAGIEFRITPLQIAIMVISLFLMFLLQYMVTSTKVGKAMRVVAFNPKIASLLSINVGNIFRLTFFLAGMLAGAAGVLYGLAFPSITPFMGNEVALKGLTVIVLGGLGSIRGAVAGGFVVAAIEVYATAIGYGWLSEASVFIALFLILLTRPQGLLGQATIKRA